VNEPVQYCVGQCRIADGLMPVLEWELAGNDGRAAAVAVLEDLRQDRDDDGGMATGKEGIGACLFPPLC